MLTSTLDLIAVAPTNAPDGYIVHTEGTTSILFKAPPGAKSSAATESTASAVVFLNPVQQYNRDLSVVAIRTWSEQRQSIKAKKWEEQVMRKRDKRSAPKGKPKRKAESAVAVGAAEDGEAEAKRARLVDEAKESGEEAVDVKAADKAEGNEGREVAVDKAEVVERAKEDAAKVSLAGWSGRLLPVSPLVCTDFVRF